MVNNDNIATKRLPVKPTTWKACHKLRKPGQSFDEMLREQIPAVKALAELEDAAAAAMLPSQTAPDGVDGGS